MPNNECRKILAITDSEDHRRQFKAYLQADKNCSYKITRANSVRVAMGELKREIPDCILLDCTVDPAERSSFLDSNSDFLQLNAVPVIAVVNEGDEQVAAQAMKRGASDYLIRDALSTDVFLKSIQHVISNSLLKRKLETKNHELTQFRYLLDRSPDLLMLVSCPDMIISDANKETSVALGYRRSELLGLPLEKIGVGWPKLEEAKPANDSLRTNNYSLETSLIRKNGVEFPVELRYSLATIGNKQVLICLARDLTDRKRIERQLGEERSRALAASDFKTEFLARMSHEIRTPLSSIIGMADLLRDSRLNDEQGKLLSVLSRASEALLDLINDILDISKIEAGEVTLETTEFDVDELIGECCEILSVQGRRSGIEVVADSYSELPSKIIGDRTRLRQVLVNLLGNAVKFTREGFVSLGAKQLSETKIEFLVKDTGQGIPPEKLEMIFQPFKQADDSTTRKYGGTGLGLAISKRLVEMMGGRISVKSEVNEGSVFRFTLPLNLGGALDRDVLADNALKDVRAFVVDDNESDRGILARVLTEKGAQVISSSESKVGLEFLATDSKFDLFVIDCKMPVVGGFEFLTQAEKLTDLTTKSVMMLPSGGHRKSDVQTMEKRGIKSYLIKPLTKRRIETAVAKILYPETVQEEEKKEAPRQRDLSTLKILVVDDGADNRNLVKAYLNGTGCQVSLSENGKDAVEECQKNEYDLILMDMDMPVMDGETAVREIRKLEEASTRPRSSIVALTAKAFKEDAEKMTAAGSDGFLTKPIRRKALIDAVQEYSERRDRASSKLSHVTRAEDLEAEANPLGDRQSDQPSADGIDLEVIEELKSLCRDDEDDFYREQVQLFLERAEEKMGELEQAVPSRSHDVIRHAAHAISGSARHAGAARYGELAGEIEDLVDEQPDQVERLDELFAQLQAEYKKVLAFFRQELSQEQRRSA